jgi:hypothetical protein
MAVLEVAGGQPVQVTINNGLARNFEELTDIGRSISGGLLLTQLASSAGSKKQTTSCTTIPLTLADVNALIASLESAATVGVTFDGAGFHSAHAVIRSLTPVTTPSDPVTLRRWILTFDLIEN